MGFRGYLSTGRVLASGAICAALPLGLLGVAESQYYAFGDFRALAYGFCLYALVGCLLGFVYAFLFGGKGRRGRREFVRFAGRAAVMPALLLFIAAGAFLIYRDLWRESPGRAGFWEWAALMLLPAGALLVWIVARVLARALSDRSPATALVVLIVSLAGVLFVPGGDTVPPLPPGPQAGAKADLGRPPVIIVVADALRADVLGAYGAGPEVSPNVDAFARESVIFAEAWSAASWTRPSVASIMTGLLARTHRIVHKSDRLPEGIPTLAGQLQKSGYLTLASVTNVNLAPVFGLGRGFDTYAYHGPRPFLGAPVSASRLFLVELYRLLRLRFMPGRHEVWRYYAPGEIVSETAMGYIEQLAGGGNHFFAYIHFMETHDPYFAHPYDGRAVARVENAHPPVAKAPEFRALYRGEVRHFDGLFGKLVAFLKEKGVYDRACIILTADHGEEFADHGGFWHGTSLYQELIHVPLIVHFPRAEGAGSTRSDPVSLVDLVPTVLDLAGVKPDEELPGRSLRKPQPEDQRPVFADEDHQGALLHAVRLGRYKLVGAGHDDPRSQPEWQLFDLRADSKEISNLATTDTARLDAMRKLLQSGPKGAAGRPVASPENVEIDPETEEQLRSLGYTQ
ncbi:MAG TPA: sulfatase [Myxococcota bacterium]|nr:sulfatase [Myxococcota bacterium]